MMPKPTEKGGWVLVSFAAFLLVGCSGGSDRPTLGKVSGVVTLDGKPLPNVGVLFSSPGFRASTGFTDSNGRYELRYLRETMGAVVGEHTVRIDRVAVEGGPRVQPLPTEYNRESTLTAKVEPGKNVHNFDLEARK